MMKKNSQIHLRLETELINLLKKQAQESGMFVAELCRRKLKENLPLMKIEMMLERIEKRMKDT